jgi:hypothetical protein
MNGARPLVTVAVLCSAAVLSTASSQAGQGREGSGPSPAVALVATTIGVGPAYHPGPGAVSGSAIRGMRCSRAALLQFAVHVELFADREVVLLPAGIGVAQPRTWSGGTVTGGHCSYPIDTTDPTGLIQVAAGTRPTLGNLFALWGQQLGSRRLIGFRGAVHVYLDGRPVRGDPRLVLLTRHAEIVLEVGGYVPPHAAYLFPRGS